MTTIVRGILKSFDSATYKATVLLLGSTQENVVGIPVNQGLASPAMVAGRRVALLMLDDTNPRDGVILAVYE